jgi:hypothetical protein
MFQSRKSLSRKSQSRKSQSRRNPFASRNFSVERLEDRQMMAGDIAAFVQGGTLNLLESAGAQGAQNGVSIVQVAPGTLMVSGLQTDDGGTTAINGHASQQFSGVTSLNVNLGGGNDLVDIGIDNKPVSLNDVFINVDGTKAKFNANGFDYDKVNIANLTTTGKLTIQTGIGDDVVNIGNLRIGDNDLDAITINTGGGSDTLNLNNVQTSGNLSILTADATSKATESDRVSLQTVSAGNGILVKTGIGKDTLNATDVNAIGDIDFDTGAGNDTMKLNSVRATDEFFALLGDGNDSLDVTFLRANKATLDGGNGTDLLTTGLEGTINTLAEAHWEYINGRLQGVSAPPHSPAIHK